MGDDEEAVKEHGTGVFDDDSPEFVVKPPEVASVVQEGPQVMGIPIDAVQGNFKGSGNSKGYCMGVHVDEDNSVNIPRKDEGGPQSLESGELLSSANVNNVFNIDMSSFESNQGVRAHKTKKSKKVAAQKYFFNDPGKPSRRKRKRLEDPLAQTPYSSVPGENTVAEDNDDACFHLDLNVRASDVDALQPSAIGASQEEHVRSEVNLAGVPPSVEEMVSMEAEETVEIGKVVGADLVQHIDLIKEIIREEGFQPGNP
ncbi:hypothetical protein Hanom_Chr02g00100441 [Helianthus anomalus]